MWYDLRVRSERESLDMFFKFKCIRFVGSWWQVCLQKWERRRNTVDGWMVKCLSPSLFVYFRKCMFIQNYHKRFFPWHLMIFLYIETANFGRSAKWNHFTRESSRYIWKIDIFTKSNLFVCHWDGKLSFCIRALKSPRGGGGEKSFN